MKKYFLYILLAILLIIQIFDKNDKFFVIQIIILFVAILYGLYVWYKSSNKKL